MKKVVLGMFVLGLTSLAFSQETGESFSTVELKDVTVSAANLHYLNSVRDQYTPEVVKELQEKAASYDVTSNAGFDKKTKDSFEVVFKASNGDIITYYNRSGKILSARENFNNVVLPMKVRKKAFQDNDGWVMSGNRYFSLYHNDDIINKVYRIKLRNGNLQKNLVIDMLNSE
ncbi:MAG TPA: hypothetical protein VKN36_14180 [Eudoraea sp.]|nr:hypothetical protein [Eudoraea sp.]